MRSHLSAESSEEVEKWRKKTTNSYILCILSELLNHFLNPLSGSISLMKLKYICCVQRWKEEKKWKCGDREQKRRY